MPPFRPGRLALVLLLAVLLASLPSFTLASDNAPDRPERSRIVFIGGICSSWPLQTLYDPFAELAQWLQNDLGYAAEDLLRFSYAADGAEAYTSSDTIGSIDGEDGSAARLARFLEAVVRGPEERFDLVAFSQGGVVALYATAADPLVRARVRSLSTINSPLQGLDALRMAFGLPLVQSSCASEGTLSLADMEGSHERTSEVIQAIGAAVWNDPNQAGPRVITISNVRDVVVSIGFFYTDGRRGILPAAHQSVLYDAGGFLSEAHNAPLRVLSNPYAGPTRDALKETLALSPTRTS